MKHKLRMESRWLNLSERPSWDGPISFTPDFFAMTLPQCNRTVLSVLLERAPPQDNQDLG